MTDHYEHCLSAATAGLKKARTALNREIADYPTPISGCDAQFTRLLSDRTRIADALRVLGERPFVATPRVMEPGARVESR